MNRIGDYALIGDCHSAALVGRDGSIDWACFPRFDSPALFCRILDEERGGAFLLAPAEPSRAVSRKYLRDTNVLVSTFDASGGTLEVTDCMPVAPLDPEVPTRVGTRRAILRRARCTEGSVDVSAVVAPRFEYGAFIPRFSPRSPTSAEIVGGADALLVRATRPLEAGADRLEGRWRLAAGDEAWVVATWSRSYETPVAEPVEEDPAGLAEELATQLDDTVRFWRAWMEGCWYEGDWEDAVRRSALALKALTYAPSGAVVAAPTTSLPEEIGGTRNWDYRYTWIRDATLTLGSLFILGYTEEAAAFKLWLERTGAGRPEDLQIMYGVGGERSLPEVELPHLAGHRGSRPVRIGNAAVKQLQLDCYGQLLQAGYLFGRAGGQLTPENWRFLSGLADIVCERWRQPDQGIWEIRDDPRHFVHSKVNCWLALDRAVRAASHLGLPAPIERWEAERDEIRHYLMEEIAADGWFPQAAGFAVADASTLLVSAYGMVETTHQHVQKTVQMVLDSLGSEGLLHRYLAEDGLPGGEGAFLLCSFWLLDCLTHSGRLDEAEALMARLMELGNDVGLYAEEVDPATGEALGNFPQAFSHMALVLSCAHLSAARRGEIPVGPVDYTERALDRLLAKLSAQAD
ncbi:MAG TPA: glycoside hydrolase family 15 protein [Actinomycetota bacterium]|nr:glycoside hydrolase family 15 protein [Actinomycetota bacterium]